MLSASAVTVSGKLGGGFYGFAKDLGKLTSDHPAGQQAYWESERKAVYTTWQKSFGDCSGRARMEQEPEELQHSLYVTW